MRVARRSIILIALIAMLTAAFAVPAVAGSEGSFIAKINASRSANGLAPLESYWDLTDDARAHSNLMASRGELFHSSTLGSATTGWDRLGENVGVGPDVSTLHAAFMNSATHRNNILGDYNYVGVGVTVDGNGTMWVTVMFMKAAPGLNGGGPTTTTVPPTTTTTVPPTTTTTTTTVPPTTTTTQPQTTTTTQPQTTTTTQAPETKTKTTYAAVSDPVFEDGVSEDQVQAARDLLMAQYPRFGNPSPAALLD